MISPRLDPRALSEVCSTCNLDDRHGSRRTDKNRGSVAVELVILAPVLVVLMLFVVYVGRASGATEQLRHAADEGARAASLVSRSAMTNVATSAVQRDLASNGGNCSSASVSVTATDGQSTDAVTVVVSCVVDTRGTNLLGAHGRTVTAKSTEVIDRHRAG